MRAALYEKKRHARERNGAKTKVLRIRRTTENGDNVDANTRQNQPDITVTMIQTQLVSSLLFTRTQRTHAFLQYSREATPLQTLRRICVVREGLACSNVHHIHLWFQVDNVENRLPF